MNLPLTPTMLHAQEVDALKKKITRLEAVIAEAGPILEEYLEDFRFEQENEWKQTVIGALDSCRYALGMKPGDAW